MDELDSNRRFRLRDDKARAELWKPVQEFFLVPPLVLLEPANVSLLIFL